MPIYNQNNNTFKDNCKTVNFNPTETLKIR